MIIPDVDYVLDIIIFAPKWTYCGFDYKFKWVKRGTCFKYPNWALISVSLAILRAYFDLLEDSMSVGWFMRSIEIVENLSRIRSCPNGSRNDELRDTVYLPTANKSQYARFTFAAYVRVTNKFSCLSIQYQKIYFTKHSAPRGTNMH